MKKLPLSNGGFALLDDADFDSVSQWKWLRKDGHSTSYAYRGITGNTTITLHVQLMRPPKGMQVDHRDLNGLNCQRSNMRLATDVQNKANRPPTCRNKSGFKGVYWDSVNSRWVASISVMGKTKYIGRFINAIDAACAYDMFALRLHGEFARTNQQLLSCQP